MAKRGPAAYTKVGRRIAALSQGSQYELSKILGISQQSVSKKLRGESSILLSDMDKLRAHYEISMSYFFDEHEGLPPELETACARAARSSGPFRKLVVRLGTLPDDCLERLDLVVNAVELCVNGES